MLACYLCLVSLSLAGVLYNCMIPVFTITSYYSMCSVGNHSSHRTLPCQTPTGVMIDKDGSYLYYNYNSAFHHLTGGHKSRVKNNSQRQNFNLSRKISSSHDCLSRWDPAPSGYNHVSTRCLCLLVSYGCGEGGDNWHCLHQITQQLHSRIAIDSHRVPCQ